MNNPNNSDSKKVKWEEFYKKNDYTYTLHTSIHLSVYQNKCRVKNEISEDTYPFKRNIKRALFCGGTLNIMNIDSETARMMLEDKDQIVKNFSLIKVSLSFIQKMITNLKTKILRMHSKNFHGYMKLLILK